MDCLEEVLNFMVSKNLEIILDTISNDFSIDRDKLDKYLILQKSQIEKQVITSNTIKVSTSTISDSICQGKTKKGDPCTNKAKPNTNFCGKHSS